MSLIVEYCFSGLLFTLQSLFFIKCAIDKKYVNSKIFLISISIIISLFFSITFWYLESVTKNIVLIFINVLLYVTLYKVSFMKAVFLTFIYMGIVLLVDLVYFFGSTNLMGLSKSFLYDKLSGSWISDIIVFFLFILLMFLFRKSLKKLFDTQIDTDKKILIFLVLTFLCILLFFYTIVERFRFNNDVLLYLMCILLLLLVLSSSIKQVIENRRLSDKYDKLLEFMTTYEEDLENQRILRHEIKNEFLVIRAKLLDSQKNEEIVHYIDEILKDKITVKQEKYAKFGYLPPGIKGLCYYKVQEAENKGIHVSINISKQIKEFDINLLTLSQQRNLARILGVFLDNAKEASFVSKNKQMGLEIYYDKNKELKFIISNTYDNKIDVNKMGKEAFSTKGKGRGHGLMLVNYILEGNRIFDVKTEVSGNIYSQNLYVKLKNK